MMDTNFKIMFALGGGGRKYKKGTKRIQNIICNMFLTELFYTKCDQVLALITLSSWVPVYFSYNRLSFQN